MSRLKKIIGAVVHAPERFDDLAGRIADVSWNLDERSEGLRQRLEGAEERIGNAEERIGNTEEWIDENGIDWFMDRLCDDRSLLSRLNRGLSISPTVWGDPERLEVDETASVFTCFFNTNSGRIRIGESTFAGSGVSVLAGSHDPQLTGFMRRDAEIAEGCDIDIGNGVWLASGCTLLGPCTVGDNAVIAAGAVVIPGTKVPANTIWGGVPARQIGQIEAKNMSPENPAVKRAFERSGGILYADGWGERIPGVLTVPGHWMHKQRAGIITDRVEWKVEYRQEGYTDCRIHLSGPEGEKEIVLTGNEGELSVRLPVKEGEPGEVSLEREISGKVFMAWSVPAPANSESTIQNSDHPASPDEEEAWTDSEGKLDIGKIMEEIRAEARRWEPCEDLPPFGSMPKEDLRKGEKLKAQVKELTKDYEIPVNYPDPARNPLKRVYKKIATKLVRCATAPLSVRVTETNLAMKTALEKAVEVIDEQEKRIMELEKHLK